MMKKKKEKKQEKKEEEIKKKVMKKRKQFKKANLKTLKNATLRHQMWKIEQMENLK